MMHDLVLCNISPSIFWLLVCPICDACDAAHELCDLLPLSLPWHALTWFTRAACDALLMIQNFSLNPHLILDAWLLVTFSVMHDLRSSICTIFDAWLPLSSNTHFHCDALMHELQCKTLGNPWYITLMTQDSSLNSLDPQLILDAWLVMHNLLNATLGCLWCITYNTRLLPQPTPCSWCMTTATYLQLYQLWCMTCDGTCCP